MLRKRPKASGLIIGFVLAVLCAEPAMADSSTVSYQGVLWNSSGTPVADGNYPMVFSIWDAVSGGVKRWGDETHAAVPVQNGLFSVYLGETVGLGSLFASYGALWLEITVDTGSGPETYVPRAPLASVPYAQHARSAWSTQGNAGTGGEFIGTTNAQPLFIRTNNIERIRVLADGTVGIGATSPWGKLEVGGLPLNSPAIRVTDDTTPNAHQVFLVPKVSGGGFNLLSQTDDAGLFFKDVSGLVIGPWSSDPGAGIRVSTSGNVGIGTGTPVASAKLDVSSTTQGFAMPRMTSVQRKAIASPAQGLQVFDTTLNGFYYWNGSKWDCVSTPAGTVSYFGGGTAPSGWLECNGQGVSTTTFAELFAAIGYTYGGSGGTFNVPDLRGEFVRGWDHGRGADSGRAMGSLQGQDWKSFTFRGDPGIAYAHELNMGKNVGAYSGGYFFMGKWETTSNSVRMYWDSSEIRPRNVALMACIKY